MFVTGPIMAWGVNSSEGTAVASLAKSTGGRFFPYPTEEKKKKKKVKVQDDYLKNVVIETVEEPDFEQIMLEIETLQEKLKKRRNMRQIKRQIEALQIKKAEMEEEEDILLIARYL